MDFEKLKGIAKTATKKTMNSIAEANNVQLFFLG